jgi:hypothetical protein
LQRLEKLEKREATKQQVTQKPTKLQERAQELNIPAYQSEFLLKQQISLIDEMIDAEKKKLENLAKKGQVTTDNAPKQNMGGDDEVVFG